MSDARLGWTIDGGDLVLSGVDLDVDDGLVTAILVSLFSDARREEDPALPTAAQDLRGWWAEESPGFGSLLWTLDREKLTPGTLERAREAASTALQWLIADGIAASVGVRTEVLGTGVLLISLEIVRGTSRRWASLWHATEGVSLKAGDVFLDLAFV